MGARTDISAEEALEAARPFDPDGERAEQLLRVLGRLTELGMMLAERLVAQATADETAPIDVGEVGAAFARISRGVRMTVMLEAKLAKERRLCLDGLEAAHEAKLQAIREARWAEEREEENERVVKRQTAIDQGVKDVIRAERPEGFERERLFGRLERLWADDIETDLNAKPSLYIQTGGDDALVSEQIAAHCKALGLNPDWDLWKDSFWALEEAEDLAEGSPYTRPATGPPS